MPTLIVSGLPWCLGVRSWGHCGSSSCLSLWTHGPLPDLGLKAAFLQEQEQAWAVTTAPRSWGVMFPCLPSLASKSLSLEILLATPPSCAVVTARVSHWSKGWLSGSEKLWSETSLVGSFWDLEMMSGDRSKSAQVVSAWRKGPADDGCLSLRSVVRL